MDEKGKMNTGEYEELIKEVEANSPYKRLSSAKKKWMSVSEIAGKMRANIERMEAATLTMPEMAALLASLAKTMK